MITFGAFLQPKAICATAKKEARKVVERWDVPHTVEVDGKTVAVAVDLDDQTPRYQGTEDGRRIAERYLLEDGRTCGPSPAVPLLIATLTPLFVLTQIFLAFGFKSGALFGAAAMVAALFVIWQATFSGFFTMFCALLVAIACAGADGSALPLMAHSNVMAMFGTPVLLAVAGVFVAVYLIMRPSMSVLRTLMWGVVTLALVVFLGFHAPSWLRPVVLFLPLGLLPFAYAWTQNNQWAAQCHEQGLSCLGEQ